MSLDTLRKKDWKVALTSGLALVLAAAPFVCAGSDWLQGLLGGGNGVHLSRMNWQEVPGAILPGAGALVAGGLLLLPFTLGTLRIRRKGLAESATGRWR